MLIFLVLLALFSAVWWGAGVLRSRYGQCKIAGAPVAEAGWRLLSGIPTILPSRLPHSQLLHRIGRRVCFPFTPASKVYRVPLLSRYAAYGRGFRSSIVFVWHHLRSIRSATPPSFYPSAQWAGAPI